MKKKLFLLTIISLLMFIPIIINAEENNIISYQTYGSGKWSNAVSEGVSGTTGKSTKINGIRITSETNGIEYATYNSNSGWQDYKTSGMVSGEESNKDLSAIKIRLTNDLESEYDVYYRTHISYVGWLDWARNDQVSGAIGYNGYSIEAIDIKLIKKTEQFSGRTISINMIKPDEVRYQAHVQNIGWQSGVINGAMAGTTGKSLRVEALRVGIKSYIGLQGGIEYAAFVKGKGWQNYVTNQDVVGTTGQGLPIDAIKVRLTGEFADNYDVYYRTHVSNIGWLGWAKNDIVSGTIGYADNRIEAVEMRLVKKGAPAPGTTNNVNKLKGETVSYQAHVSNVGWQRAVENGVTAGLIGKTNQIESLRISLNDYESLTGGIEYSAYVDTIGWQEYVSGGNDIGTTGRGLRIEAIKVKLTGNVSNVYDVFYRVYVPTKGWLGWAKNDEMAGSRNYQYRVEGIEIKLVKKGTMNSDDNRYIETDTAITYRTTSRAGWGSYVYDGNVSGTTGRGIPLTGIQMSLKSDFEGTLQYQGHISYVGWTTWRDNNTILGNTSGTALEAIRIKLTGELAEKYDIYYRAHSQNFGWLGWAKNGEDSGTEGYGYAIEAIQIVLVEKNGNAPGSTVNPYFYMGFYKGNDGYTHYRQRNGKDATDWIVVNGVKYFFNSLGQQIGGANVRKVIDVSSHQEDIDWDTVKNTGIDGVIVRVAAGSSAVDSKLKRNTDALKRLNIPYGLYIYSYAENQTSTVTGLTTAHEGALEAYRMVKAIEDYNLNPRLPIYYDLEHWDYSTANHYWTANDYEPIIYNFNRVMTEKGYGNWKIYTNKSLAESSLGRWKSKVDWVAQLNHHCTYSGSYSGWQYSFTEHIEGIRNEKGQYINTDASVWFKPF